MRQILCNSGGALVARQPCPAIRDGAVLVRVHFSLVSAGTELAGLRKSEPAEGTPIERAAALTDLAYKYLGKALRDPRKAAERLAQLGRTQWSRLVPPRPRVPAPHFSLDAFQWTPCAARRVAQQGGRLELETDASPAAYQVMSQAVACQPGRVPVLVVSGRVRKGGVAIGLLNEDRSAWLGSHTFPTGPIHDRLTFDPRGSQSVTVVVTNDGTQGNSELELDAVELEMAPPAADGLPHSELADQGWHLGYSAAGEVVAVGAGVNDLCAGDRVACAGAGYANHADYVCVPRNLVCRVDKAVDLEAAATTTVGAIALQGVRRAAPQLGETVCVIGLGLIGQLTAQLLEAAGCRVIGHDLSEVRVRRGRELAVHDGTHDPEELRRLVRDRTGGRGVDCTLVTAATRSDGPVNLAFELTRAKGRVVLVGDVGLKLRREQFYRKEIDLLMSTSYGPGRYDADYEEAGRDYPFAYVRWTLGRNMQAYLELCAAGKIRPQALIDRVVRVDEAPAAYDELARSADSVLGLLVRYADDQPAAGEPADATAIRVRGHRPAPQGPLCYALVGVGGFGTGMLVPKMKLRPDRFFLRAVVSRHAAQAGNFARSERVEVLASRLEAVLDDPRIDLVVIATRHHEHAAAVTAALAAGKHVFVEKPLAIRWDELDAVARACQAAGDGPRLMVGFNRRFSPAILRLGEELAGRRGPLVIQYRLHAGYLPPDHWVQGPQGGGRNLGEACHMYDCFRALTGCEVRSIAATAIDPGGLPYQRSDNFSATLRYADGSLANLVYTSLGPSAGLGKERIEVFCDGQSWLVDDFRRLVRASDQAVLWQSSEPDKGHAEQLSRWGDALASGGPPPIQLDELLETTAVALHVEDLLHERA